MIRMLLETMRAEDTIFGTSSLLVSSLTLFSLKGFSKNEVLIFHEKCQVYSFWSYGWYGVWDDIRMTECLLWHKDATISFVLRSTIRAGGSTARLPAYTVNTANTVGIVDMVFIIVDCLYF